MKVRRLMQLRPLNPPGVPAFPGIPPRTPAPSQAPRAQEPAEPEQTEPTESPEPSSETERPPVQGGSTSPNVEGPDKPDAPETPDETEPSEETGETGESEEGPEFLSRLSVESRFASPIDMEMAFGTDLGIEMPFSNGRGTFEAFARPSLGLNTATNENFFGLSGNMGAKFHPLLNSPLLLSGDAKLGMIKPFDSDVEFLGEVQGNVGYEMQAGDNVTITPQVGLGGETEFNGENRAFMNVGANVNLWDKLDLGLNYQPTIAGELPSVLNFSVGLRIP